MALYAILSHPGAFSGGLYRASHKQWEITSGIPRRAMIMPAGLGPACSHSRQASNAGQCRHSSMAFCVCHSGKGSLSGSTVQTAAGMVTVAVLSRYPRQWSSVPSTPCGTHESHLR